jgi:hypothetical protein
MSSKHSLFWDCLPLNAQATLLVLVSVLLLLPQKTSTKSLVLRLENATVATFNETAVESGVPIFINGIDILKMIENTTRGMTPRT